MGGGAGPASGKKFRAAAWMPRWRRMDTTASSLRCAGGSKIPPIREDDLRHYQYGVMRAPDWRERFAKRVV